MPKPITIQDTQTHGECGVVCWKVNTNKNSNQPPEWFIVPEGSAHPYWNFGSEPPDKIYVGTSPSAGDNFEFQICLNPIDHPPGEYYVGAWRWFMGKHWIWSEKTITYGPNPSTLLATEIDGNGNYDLGKIDCESPLVLTARRQKCLARYRVRVKRMHQGIEYGPEVWLTGAGWVPGPLGIIDLRALAAAAGYDFVPGQCYKIDVFSDFFINNTQWKSTGHIFCIDCCCR